MLKLRKFLSILFFVAIAILLIYIIQNYGIEPLRIQVANMGIWAPLGIFILRGISIILPALPSSAYSLLAGSLLGFKTGYFTILISDMVFCQVAFLGDVLCPPEDSTDRRSKALRQTQSPTSSDSGQGWWSIGI